MEMMLEAGDARVVIDPRAGGRIGSLDVSGLELLVGRCDDLLAWGCYPMAPYAGRVRNGLFTFDGTTHRLPLRLPPHAIHGTVFERPWRVDGDARLSIDLGPDWPFAGTVIQRFDLQPDFLDLHMEVRTDGAPFPASIGWHPWFRRRLSRGSPARLSFDPRKMYLRDETGISSSRIVSPPPGPWDDCFTDVRSTPSITWPGALALWIESLEEHWVVYDEPAHAICVEPMTGPIDSINSAPRLVTRESPLTMQMRLAWKRLGDEASRL